MMSRAHFAALLRGKCSEVVCILQVSNSRHSPVHFLSTTCADRAPNPRKQRPYTSATTEATLLYPEKTRFRARDCFHP